MQPGKACIKSCILDSALFLEDKCSKSCVRSFLKHKADLQTTEDDQNQIAKLIAEAKKKEVKLNPSNYALQVSISVLVWRSFNSLTRHLQFQT